MRNLWVWLLLGLAVALAQEEDENKADLSPRRKGVRWDLLSHQEIAYNRLMGAPDTLAGSLEGLGSIKLNLSWIPNLRMGAFYIGAGLGLAIREVRFEEPVILYRTPEKRMGYTIDVLPDNTRAKSKLQLGYIRLPLELGILRRKFNLAVFGYGEALLWAKHKRKYREGNDLARFISYGNRVVQTDILQYGVGARLGYRGIGVFAAYNLSPLWSGDRGPSNVHFLQAGIYFFESGRLGSSSTARKARATATGY